MGKTRNKRNRKGGNKTHSKKKHSNAGCNTFDTQLTKYVSNSVWRTCIRHNNIYYIIPKNAVLKDIKTVRAPKFAVKLDGTPGEFSVQIEDQYISCFLHIKKQWYALAMVNFAITQNFRYYRLDGVDSLYDKNGTIKLKNAKLQTNLTDTISITKTTPILKTNDNPIYDLLNNFVTQKLVASTAREFVTDMILVKGVEELL